MNSKNSSTESILIHDLNQRSDGGIRRPNGWVGGLMLKIEGEFEKSLGHYTPIKALTPYP